MNHGRTKLTVTLLTHPIHLHLLTERRGEGCVVCRRRLDHADLATCERCGIDLHYRCYRARVATPLENLFRNTDWGSADAAEAVLRELIMLCQGCRS